jgi:hypothetical protein
LGSAKPSPKRQPREKDERDGDDTEQQWAVKFQDGTHDGGI